MEVGLVSITKSVLIHGDLHPEDLIIYIARVSNPDNQWNKDTYGKLMGYLIEHKHWSPFEMVDMCVEIETSRAVAAQILRHKSFSFQEFSQRYSQVPGCEPIELRLKAEKNRQSSSEVTNEYDRFVDEVVRDSFRLYEFLVMKGVSKETARMILPLGTKTRMYMKGNIRSWIHYFMVRLNKDTQKEHLDVAFEIFQLFSEQFPKISDLLIEKKYIDI